MPTQRNRIAPILRLLVVAMCMIASPTSVRADYPWTHMWDGGEVGTPSWWKKHRYKDAEFEVGKGYKVPGVDGYFDQNGRPIDKPVANSAVPRPDDDDDEDKGILPGLDPKVAYGKMKSAVGLGPNDAAAHAKIVEAERLFQQGSYKKASKLYDEATDRAIDMRLKEDAMFMTAESYFFDDRYIKARDAYDLLASKYPSTRYLDRLIAREWSIAQYWEHYESYSPDWPATPNGWDKTRPWFDTVGHAIKTYENIRLNDPTGPRADDALMAEAGIYFRMKRYDDADYNYQLVRREYPRSEFQFQAHMLGLYSKLYKYQGDDYDGTALEEAQTLITQLRRNFAGQLSTQQRDELQTYSANLNQELAARTMKMAKHYDGTKYYGSAKGYYAEVIRKWPNSEYAQEARERYKEIAPEPEVPAKHLAWVIEKFPKSQEHMALANIPELKDGRLIAQSPDSTRDDTMTAKGAPATTTK